MIAARELAILDLLHHGCHPPAPSHLDHARQLQKWACRETGEDAPAEEGAA